MSFFKNKIVRIIAIVLWLLSTVVLVIGGTTEAEFNGLIAVVFVAVAAISAVITTIGTIISIKDKKTE